MKVLAGMLEDGEGHVLADTVFVADGWWSRLRGLIARPPLARGQALWILPCSQVHTHFMRASIGVVFLSPEMQVLRVIAAMPPWRVSPWVRGAASALEFSAKWMPELRTGGRLCLQQRAATAPPQGAPDHQRAT